MRIARIIALLAALITTPLLSVPTVLGATLDSAPSGPVSVNPDLQSDGVSMVWSSGNPDMLVPPAPEASDIWMSSVTDRTPARVTTDNRHVRQAGPDVSGEVVVWTEWSPDGDDGSPTPPSVWIKDVAIGIETRVASDASNIVIEGTWFAYRRGSTLNVSNINDMSNTWTVRIGEPEASVFRLSDGWAAWVEKVYPIRPTNDLSTRYPQPGIWPTFKLYAMRLPDGAPQLIYEYVDYADFGLAWWDLAGDTLAFHEMRGNPTAIMLDLPTGAKQSVVLDRGWSGPDYRIATNGRYLFWIIPIGVSQGDLYAYDSYAGSMFATGLGVHFWANLVTRGSHIIWTPGIYEQPGGLDDIHNHSLPDVLPSARRPDPKITDPNWTWHPETGHYLAWDFRAYWNANGGLSVFGYPLTEEYSERNADTGQEHTVQMFERQRFEWHPENAGTPYEVLLGRLGVELLLRQGRDWTTFAKADPTTPYFMPETGHAIAPGFWDYWTSHGLEFGDPGVSFRESLALFGYPLSEPMVETNADGDTVLTQYFERAVFELHPGNPVPYRVLLRRLGAEVLSERGW